MSSTEHVDDYARLTAPSTLFLQRVLPGPIDRVWQYLTDSDLRRQWLAAGTMQLVPGAPFELVWRNDELTHPPMQRPEGFGQEERMQSEIIAADPPHRLVFRWGETGEVRMELAEQGAHVVLSLTHLRVSDPAMILMVGPGWHAHLDVLRARLAGTEPAESFWDAWLRLQAEYTQRLSA